MEVVFDPRQSFPEQTFSLEENHRQRLLSFSSSTEELLMAGPQRADLFGKDLTVAAFNHSKGEIRV